MEKEYYTFPAIVSKTGTGYGLHFYDLPGCIATGKTMDEAAYMAKEGLALHLWGMEQDGEKIPAPTPIDEIPLGKGEAICLLDANMAEARKTA